MKLNNLGANQTEISLNDNMTVLFSYKTPVAANIGGQLYRTDCRWSVTTSKHINKWLNGAKAEYKEQAFFDGLVK